MMTRRDFEMIARDIRYAWAEPEKGEGPKDFARRVKLRVALNLADDLAANNPRFDRERFLKACGP